MRQGFRINHRRVPYTRGGLKVLGHDLQRIAMRSKGVFEIGRVDRFLKGDGREPGADTWREQRRRWQREGPLSVVMPIEGHDVAGPM